jgi:hypothetical protein
MAATTRRKTAGKGKASRRKVLRVAVRKDGVLGKPVVAAGLTKAQVKVIEQVQQYGYFDRWSIIDRKTGLPCVMTHRRFGTIELRYYCRNYSAVRVVRIGTRGQVVSFGNISL